MMLFSIWRLESLGLQAVLQGLSASAISLARVEAS